MGEPSLYERLGGVYAINALVDSFSDQLVEKGTRGAELEDQGLERRQGRSSAARPEVPADTVALRDRRRAVRVHGPTSGRCTSDLQLSSSDFDQVAAVLADTLEHFNVPPREKEEVLGAFEAHRPEVTAGSSSLT